MGHRMAKVVNVRNIITNGNIKNKYLCVHPDVNKEINKWEKRQLFFTEFQPIHGEGMWEIVGLQQATSQQ